MYRLQAVSRKPQRLGLHVTQAELNLWRRRAVSGPFKRLGDFAPNSPGDWDRVVAGKNTFLSNPNRMRYSGPTSGWPVGPRSMPLMNARSTWDVSKAAFYALIEQDQEVADAVRTVLLAQARDPGTDFSDRDKYARCPGDGVWLSFSTWMYHLIYAYDYLRILGAFSDAERNEIEHWLRGYAYWIYRHEVGVFDSWYVDRWNEDYDGTFARYQSGHPGDPARRIDGIQSSTGWFGMHFVYTVVRNYYWQSDYVWNMAHGKGPGDPGFPKSPNDDGAFYAFMYPATMLMFGGDATKTLRPYP